MDGLLIRLPCHAQDMAYWVNDWFTGWSLEYVPRKWHITESKVQNFVIADPFHAWIRLENGELIPFSEEGKTLFFAPEEAEQELRRREAAEKRRKGGKRYADLG